LKIASNLSLPAHRNAEMPQAAFDIRAVLISVISELLASKE
jgi:hypothetical protein